jgi:hypothetical protein
MGVLEEQGWVKGGSEVYRCFPGHRLAGCSCLGKEGGLCRLRYAQWGSSGSGRFDSCSPACEQLRPANSINWSMVNPPSSLMSSLSRSAAAFGPRVWRCVSIGSVKRKADFNSSPTSHDCVPTLSAILANLLVVIRGTRAFLAMRTRSMYLRAK